MNKCNIDDLLSLFEDYVSPADVLSARLISQVSSAITKERLRLNMTQSEFAEHIGVKQSQISRWERGGYNFTIEKIAAIAVQLDLDVNITFKASTEEDSLAEDTSLAQQETSATIINLAQYRGKPLNHFELEEM